MTTWHSDTVVVGGLNLHYTRTGGDGPPLVLAHGFSDDGLCWGPVARALEGEYDIIMVDARGHGRSDGPESGYGSHDMANDLAGVIRALELQRPAVLGHSMGAMTALALASAYPDLPGAILLEDPPAGWVPPPPPPPGADARQNRMRDWIVGLKRKTREEMIAAQRAESPGWSEEELGPWADSKLRLSFNVLDRTGIPPIEWPALLQRITCPTLLITGDPEQGALVSAEAATAFTSLVPHARVVHIAGAGHSIRRDRFAPFMAAVRAFLAS